MAKLHPLSFVIGSIFAANSYAMTPQPDPDNIGGYVIERSEIITAENIKTMDPMYDVWAQALVTASNSIVESILPGLSTNPDNVKRVERVFPETEWNYLTQMAAPEYTYTRFLRAIGKFPAFCGDYTDDRDADAICKKSIVTAFAHFAQETGGHISIENVSDNPLGLEEWQQALVHVREMGWSEGQPGYTTGCGQNDWQNKRWPCAEGQGYFGRGAKQLSYHFNYGAFSEVMFDGDATVLLNNPGLVADSWLNLASAIWFFLTPQAPKPAMLHVIDRTWVPSQRETDAGIGYGFGTTINVINGGIECGEQNKDKGQPVNRIRYWEGLVENYQITLKSDETNTCWQQTPYGSLNLNGATDVLYTNWDANWKYYPDRPGGASFECELVGFQTAYSALVAGDYEKCVTNFYGSHANWPEVRVVEKLDPDTGGDATDPSDPPIDGVASWDKNKVYTGGEQIAYKGAVYEAKWWSQNNQPDLGDPWKLIKAVTDDTITPPVTPPTDEKPSPDLPADVTAWESHAVYGGNDKVSYQDKIYKAKWWSQGNTPTAGDPWALLP
ncbi:chitinase [Photobacterium toruni]|uniref:chitinase n=1 Tax=Photobacterium toruni TaxID=1935446 RepID=UPI0021103B89|nr:glycoside hydrolase family 19 protein [Photobacterium toruni]